MPPANEFAELLERVRQGDRAALVSLLTQYEPALRRFARAHLGPSLRPHADSVDLVQSAHKSLMIALWSNRYEFSSAEKLLALARTILQRKVARLAERMRRQQNLSTPRDGDSAPEAFQSLAGAGSDPGEDTEFRYGLAHACRHLTDPVRRTLTLLLQGYTRKEIAESLGEDPDAFRVYWSRVLERLRDSGALNAWIGPANV